MALCFRFDLARVFFRVPPCLTITNFFFIFRNCRLCGKGALCFSFDIARVFLHVPSCEPYTPIFVLRNVINLGKGHYASGSTWPWYFFRVHHATHTIKKYLYLSLWEGSLCFSFHLAKVFLQGATMPPLNHFL
jgi:hypothetical protein